MYWKVFYVNFSSFLSLVLPLSSPFSFFVALNLISSPELFFLLISFPISPYFRFSCYLSISKPLFSIFRDSPLLSLPKSLVFVFSPSHSLYDGELSQHKNTRVPSGPRYELRKRTHSQQQKNNILLLIHKFEKLTIHEMNEEDLSKA